MFGETLRKIRRKRNISTSEMYKALHVSKTTYYAWEDNTRKIPSDMIYPICKILNISSDYFFNYNDFHNANSNAKKFDTAKTLFNLLLQENNENIKILLHLAQDWSGDFDALVKINALYASLPPSMRKDVSGLCIHLYEMAKLEGKILDPIGDMVNVEEQKAKWEILNKRKDK